MLRPLIIWGASGQARVLHEFLGPAGYELVAFFDNNPDVPPPYPNIPLYRGWEGFREWRASYTGPSVAGVVAIGSPGQARLEIHALMEQSDVEVIRAIHPTAFVARDARIGKGSQILAQAAIAAEASIGEQCIVNTAASVDHESVIGNGVHVAPGARVLGCVRIEDYAFIGAGAIVISRLTVGTNAIIGAGAVVTKDVPDNMVVYGNPAIVKRRNLQSV